MNAPMQVKCPGADGLAHRPGFGPAYRVTVGNRWYMRPDLPVYPLDALTTVDGSRTSCGLSADSRAPRFLRSPALVGRSTEDAKKAAPTGAEITVGA